MRFPALSVSEVSNFLANRFHIETAVAESAATLSQGNLNEAIQILQGAKSQNLFFDLFVKMMRAAYTANPIELMDISDEAASLDKENQKIS